MTSQAKAASQSYRALVGEQAFDITVEGGRFHLGGEPVEVSFEPVTGDYFVLLADGRSVPVLIEPGTAGRLRVTLAGRRMEVSVLDETDLLLERFGMGTGAGEAAREIHAPMPGLVLAVLVQPGQAVQAGDGLLVLEAMKMENELRAPADGVVRAVHVAPGDAVGKNALLIEFEA